MARGHVGIMVRTTTDFIPFIFRNRRARFSSFRIHRMPARTSMSSIRYLHQLSLPRAELYPREDDTFIALDAGLTSGRASWEQSQGSKG